MHHVKYASTHAPKGWATLAKTVFLLLCWACVLMPISMGRAADKPGEYRVGPHRGAACVSAQDVSGFGHGHPGGKPVFRCGHYVGRLDK